MKKFAADFFRFMRVNRFYILLLVLCGAAVFAASRFSVHAPEPQESPAITEFKQAEEALNRRVKEEGSIENFLAARPHLRNTFAGLTLFIFFSFGAGIILNLIWMANPKWRQGFFTPPPPSSADWHFGMLFRVVVLFTAWSLCLSLIFAWLRETVLQSLSLNFFTLLHTTVVDILCLALVVWSVQESRGRLQDLGFHFPEGSIRREVAAGFGAYFSVVPVFLSALIVLVVISQLIAYEPPPHPLVSVFLEEEERSPWLVGYSIFLATVLGPVLEEIFFRGFCIPVFRRYTGKWGGMILSSVFFAAIHANAFAFFPIFILGMGLAYVYEMRGRSLFAPIIMHVVHNSVFITYFFLAKDVVLNA